MEAEQVLRRIMRNGERHVLLSSRLFPIEHVLSRDHLLAEQTGESGPYSLW